MPNRLFLTWEAWLREQWNRPDRADHYAMQAAQCSLAPHLKAGATLPDCRIRFAWKRAGDEAEAGDDVSDVAEVAKLARAASIARLAAAGALKKGLTVTTVPAPQSETTYSTGGQ